MTAVGHDKLRGLFARAVELDTVARSALLRDLSASDPELGAELESLLHYHDRADAILDRTPVMLASGVGETPRGGPGVADGGGVSQASDELRLPATIGAFTLLRVIGAGGMGVVYEAEQASPSRRVAVKLIRPEIVSPSMLRRFEHEGEALGMLEHPGIARVYETGRAVVQGYPRAFIAMELVDGPTLTEHARSAALSPPQRMDLLAAVCDAVQHAHRRGIVHRDLKPANILVGPDGQPRVLDFGVARLAPDGQDAATLRTAAGQIVGTLAYMSPEQAIGDPAQIDTRSDVYSLGALLFELLCGEPPHATAGLSLQSALAAISAAQPRVPRTIRRTLGRDVEAIFLRALERDPARRYQHASDLADDLRRIQRCEPITARAPSALYQCSRFCARNKEIVAAGGVVLATMIVAIVLISASFLRADRARVLAERSAREASLARDEAVAHAEQATRNMERYQAVSGFTHFLLGGIRPEIARGEDTALLRILLDNSEQTLHTLDDQPAALADAHALLANIYRSLGEFTRAESHGRAALDLYLRHVGEADRGAAVTMHNLGALYRGSLGRPDEAEPLLRRAAELFGQLGEESEARNARSSLALVYLDLGRVADAEPILRELREFEERTSGPDHPVSLTRAHNHAAALWLLGRFGDAEPLARSTLDRRTAVLGEDHTAAIATLFLLADIIREQGRAGEALPLVERGIELRHAILGEEHPATLRSRSHLVNCLQDLNRLEEASSEAERLVQATRQSLGEHHLDSLLARLNALELRVLLGRCDGAVHEADDVLAALGALGPNAGYWPSVAGVERGLALACAGERSAAAACLTQAHAELATRLGPTHRHTRRAARALEDVGAMERP